MAKHTDTLLSLAREVSGAPPRRELDMLLTVGERTSMALLSMALADRGVEACSLTGSQCGILTDGVHGNARIDEIRGDRVHAALDRGQVVIVGGFQGVHPQSREITTLGRGGTDLSAIALAIALEATDTEIYTDVAGVFTADPRVVPTARLQERMPCSALRELTWHGAKVMHSRSVFLASKFGLPFKIRSSFDWEAPGTQIQAEGNRMNEDRGRPSPRTSMERPIFFGIAQRRALASVRSCISRPRGLEITAEMVRWLWSEGHPPHLGRGEASGDSWILNHWIPGQILKEYRSKLVELAGSDLKSQEIRENLATLTLVGEGFWQTPEVWSMTRAALADCEIIASESTDTTWVAALHDQDLECAAQRLHAVFFEQR